MKAPTKKASRLTIPQALVAVLVVVGLFSITSLGFEWPLALAAWALSAIGCWLGFTAMFAVEALWHRLARNAPETAEPLVHQVAHSSGIMHK